MKFLLSFLVTLISIPSFADSASLAEFLNAGDGNWAGQGTVVLHIGHTGTYKIAVRQTSAAQGTDLWSVMTAIKGMPTSSSTTVQYKISGEELQLATPQFTAVLHVLKSTATELSYEMTHVDAVTGRSVRVAREMTLTANGMDVTSDVYQSGQLAQHFVYKLQKTP